MATSEVPATVLAAARTAVQRHFHEGDPWAGHNVDPLRCQICNDAADVASRVAYNAGRELALGDRVVADERPAYRTTLWADDGESWTNWSFGRNRGTPEFEQSVLDDAEKDVGPWDGTCSVVRTEVQKFREVTYRVDMTILARFGDWSEVPDA